MHIKHRYDHNEDHLQSKLEKIIHVALSPVASFIYRQSTPFILLLIASLASIIIINFYDSNYINSISKNTFGIYFNNLSYAMPVKEWLNCGLMTIFFMVIGLEIKREIYAGKLKNKNELIFIIFCTIGGMIVPSLIYLSLNSTNTEYINGWIIPMSTDTVFAMGILSLLTKSLTIEALVVFSALVIFDDIGTVLLSTLVSEHIYYKPFIHSIIVYLSLIMANKSGIKSPWVYFILGLLAWHYTHEANLHTSLAGLIVAYTIPIKPYISHKKFITIANNILCKLENNEHHENKHTLTEELNLAIEEYSSPLQRWESKITMPVCIFILPLFYFINSDIQISWQGIISTMQSSIAWGIMLGLIIGKPLGIILFSLIAQKFKIGVFPKSLYKQDFIGISLLAGVGFTMSIYHAELVFNAHDSLLQTVKLSILISSAISTLLTITYLKRINKNTMVKPLSQAESYV